MTGWTGEPGVLRLPDGRVIRGQGLRHSRGSVPPADFTVYLLGRPPVDPPPAYRWVRWRDFRTPSSRADALDALDEAHRRARVERVELTCGGGIGRTGTALAVLTVLAGLDADSAIDFVRAHYHRRAVETPWQRAWVRSVATDAGTGGHRAALTGGPLRRTWLRRRPDQRRR